MPLQDLLAQYERRRQQAYAEVEAHRTHAAAVSPEIAALEEEKKSLRQSIVQAMRTGESPGEAAKRVQQKLQRMEEAERKLLQAAGLPADYLEQKASCALCGDTGYVGAHRREMCSCLVQALLLEQRASSQIDPNETFETFDPAIYPTPQQAAQMQKARDVALRFVQGIPGTERHNLVLLGEAGLGKTFLLNCIAAQALKQGISMRKVTAYTLMDEILAGIRRNEDRVSGFLSLPLLLIDDLGTEPMMNNITKEYLFSILNERRNGKRYTAVASNLSVDTLQDRYGERVFSRLISTDDAYVMKVSGKNLRLFRNSGGGV